MEKDWKLLIENRFQKNYRKNSRKNPIFWKSRFSSKIFGKSKTRNFLENRDFRRKFRVFDFAKIFDENLDFSKNVEIFLKSVRYFFEIRFSIKSFQYFSMIFFLNRSRIVWIIQKWRLEVPKTQRGRVSEQNVKVYRIIKRILILPRKC